MYLFSKHSEKVTLTLITLFFLFFANTTQADPMYGLFMIVKGDVNFKNPNASIEKAKVGAKVFEGALITTEKDSRAKIVMSDRNVLNLSPDSKLTIQKYENAPGKKNVSLSLQEGKVRLNVEQKYDGSKEKFLIKTPTVVAGVRGTQFLTSYDSQSKTSQVVTFKGTVTMTSFNANGSPISTVKIEKGQSSTAAAGQAPEPPKNVPKEELKALDKSTASTGSEKKPEPKGTDPKVANGKDDNSDKKEPKLTNSKDLDTSLAKDIPPLADGGSKPPPPLAPPPPTTALPPPPQAPSSIIQNQYSKTKVTINVTH